MAVIPTRALAAAALFLSLAAGDASAQNAPAVGVRGDSVVIRLVDVDLRAAIQALGRHTGKAVFFDGVAGNRVTFETPGYVHRGEVVNYLRGMLEGQNYDLVDEGLAYRVRPKVVAQPPQPIAPMPQPEAPPRAAPRGSGGLQLYVIRLRHAKAADVAATVNALYGRASALGELGGRRPTLGENLRDDQYARVDAPPAATAPGAVVGNAQISGETTIVPDARTNSLLIRAQESDYQLILAAVEQVDVRPLQVAIQVIIAEVQRNSEFSMGLGFSFDTTRVRGGRERVGVTNAGDSVSAAGLVVRALGLGGYRFNATLTAAAARGEASILSRPLLLTANNESARLSVGDQRPFVQLTSQTSGDRLDQVVQYRDVGTELNVTPTISQDGYVLLDVTQEVNAVLETDARLNAPVIGTRSIQTQLLVRDGQTAVLGGLSDLQRGRGSSGIPFLSSLPVIGGLFGSRSRRVNDVDLYIFLTPRIIRGDEDMDDAAASVRDNTRVREIVRKAKPILPPPPVSPGDPAESLPRKP